MTEKIPPQAPAGPVTVSAEISADLRKRLRVHLAKTNLKQKDFIADAIEEKLDREAAARA